MNLHLFLIFTFLTLCQSKKHQLKITDDQRNDISLTSFGFYQHGHLNVTLDDFSYYPRNDSDDVMFGFTFEKIMNDAIDPHMEANRQKCLLKDEEKMIQNQEDIIFFIMNLKEKVLRVNCSSQSSVAKIRIYKDSNILPVVATALRNGKQIDFETGASCLNLTIPITTSMDNKYNSKFTLYIPTENEEGLYELFFYSCLPSAFYSFSIDIEEYNLGSYLSAGDIPLPALYFVMSILFFFSALFWIYILIKSRHPVYKIHYLMGTLVILKSMALLFHGINYHYIEIKGEPVFTWAILYYVIHLLKGSVLFITIILIGTGWTFIKHILSPKDKRIFMIVIPLQVFANVAEIIIDESEQGDVEHRMWLDVFTFVDLICCFAILFPIVWSIKHLQDASQTDGKAAINLKKLKLFRHFYIMIVCYIYFTRIIVYLLKMTVPFQYSWLDEMFREIATFLFFVLTGYKFRPASENPYFYLPEEDENEMEVVFTRCGFTEGLTKLNRISNEAGDDADDALLVTKRESSHDYD